MPTVGLVGVGLIGRAWANVFSRSGWDVRIWDPEPKALAAAPALIAQSLQDVARHGLAKDPEAAAKRVRSAASLEDAVQGTELVIESGPERVEVKIDLFAAARCGGAGEHHPRLVVLGHRHLALHREARRAATAASSRIPSTRRTWCRSWSCRAPMDLARDGRARAPDTTTASARCRSW